MGHSITLDGLDGANLLGFMAALGTLRTLTRGLEALRIRLSWTRSASWVPVIHSSIPLGREGLLNALEGELTEMRDHPALGCDPTAPLGNDLTATAKEFRTFAEAAGRTALRGDSTWAEFAASFGCDQIMDGERIADTALRTMSGAGHQHFLEFMRQLARCTKRTHLSAALFESWTYSDPGPSMRWDPEDDRRYAYRWKDPSKKRKGEKTTVRGANLLAVCSLPIFPTAPSGERLATAGFRGHRARDTFLRWPIWTRPATIDTARSLLTLPAIQADPSPRRELGRRGIEDVFQVQRLTIEKFRSFSPARSV